MYLVLISIIILLSNSITKQYDKFYVIPFIVFWFLLKMVFEIKELFKKNDLDKEINNQKYLVCSKKKNKKKDLQVVQSRNITVGNIIRINQDQIIPADILILDTQLVIENNSVCYADYSNIDGNQNLVLRKAL